MLTHFKKTLPLSLLTLLLPMVAQAAPAVSVTDYQASPPILSTSSKPMVLLALSNDHQLYFKSYSDYDDLDGDGTVETTYTHGIDYVGYFDSDKCYDYATVSSRFEPKSKTTDKYCAGGTAGEWSGNFLNWVSMTRIDQIRKVLYGGFRRVDTASATVLERSFLVNDAHSFAKYYNGTDLSSLTPFNPATVGAATSASGMTFCNTTYVSTGESQNIDTSVNPPLIRAVEGNYSLWAAGERFQCRFRGEAGLSASGSQGKNNNPSAASGIPAYDDSPAVANKIGDYAVRVAVCVDGLEESDCKKYPTSDHKKPTGLLQDYGDEEDILFGLMTGSYLKNKQGGVLRKNVGAFTDEVNALTDGTFKTPASGEGIIAAIDKFRLARYKFDDGLYNSTDNCPWALSSFTDGRCSNWGNPFSEIVLECFRYFGVAGDGNANPNFVVDDSTVIPGLQTSTWKDQLNSSNSCSQLSIVAFNASTSSYDSDNLTGVNDLQTTETAAQLTQTVGTQEGIDGNDYFVGEVVGDTDQLCNAKTVANLGEVKGTCPDAPRLEGSYHAAGLAYHVYQTDIRPDLDGSQNVNTYAVTLAPAIPSAELLVPGSTGKYIKILPACRNKQTTPDSNCAIVDFKVVQSPVLSAGTLTAKYYVNWEDSEQGGDYDQDMHGVIDVSLTATGLDITTKVIGQSTGDQMGFGYIVSGTDGNDGFHAHSGINGFDLSDCGGGCNSGDAANTATYTVGITSASLLESPLYYAAKFGGFNDINGNGQPDSVDEWDVKDINGDFTPDGLPDNYFPVTNPLQLKSALSQVFSAIGAKLTTSSAAAVVANTSGGSGAVYQGVYFPTYEDSAAVNIKWAGFLHAMFRDESGNLREDTNENKQLDDYSTDYKIEIFYDDARQETRIRRLVSSDGGLSFTEVDQIDFEDVKSVWNARNELANLSNSEVLTQRSYSASADSGRFIFTGTDTNQNGRVEASETEAFIDTNFDELTEDVRYLGLDSTNYTEGAKIVNYIRGYDAYSGYRNRTLHFDGGNKVWRLGDIIHSEPAVVSKPSARYDFIYGDETYRAFRAQYESRRNMVYVGANDGMLHAFNAGFYDPNTESFLTKPSDTSTVTEHPLGTELWAYVPQAVLPHLRWLTAPDYGHVYYVDGSPRVYDVNIFTPDEDHPYGWGTILVMGIRFGGAEVTFDPDSDEAAGAPDADNDNITTRSSYIVMDITNPEVAPELIAEISYVPAGGISNVTISAAGTHFSQPDVTITGDGVGATAKAILSDTPVSNSGQINTAGSGYSPGDLLPVSYRGSPTGVNYLVTSVGLSGEITGGYLDGTLSASIKEVDVDVSGSGDGLADISILFEYSLEGIAIINPGEGYTAGLTSISISDTGTGSPGSADFGVFDIGYLGYTTPKPVVVKSRLADDSGSYENPSLNQWLLLMGSGPTGSEALNGAESDANAQLVMFDLVNKNFVSGFTPDPVDSTTPEYDLTSHPNSYVGDLATVDWDRDYTDDAVYFGIINGDAVTPDGTLKRLGLDLKYPARSELITLLDVDGPVVNAPRLQKDAEGNRWVYAGTGRYFVTEDNTDANTYYYYGIIDDTEPATISLSDMVEVTDYQVFTLDPTNFNTVNYVRDCPYPCASGGSDAYVNGVQVNTWQDLKTEILKTSGWYRELELDNDLVGVGASRTLGPSNMVGSALLYTEYAPSTDQCQPVGFSRINVLHFQTGTASPYAVIGEASSEYNSANLAEVGDAVRENALLLGGDGQGDQDNADGDGSFSTDKGEIDRPDLIDPPYAFGRQSWKQININWNIE